MKTLNALFSIAAIALCCSTAAFAEQNVQAKAVALDPAGCEELIITAQRVTPNQAAVLSAPDRSALAASIKTETRKEIQHLMQQFLVTSAKTAMQSLKNEVLQASL